MKTVFCLLLICAVSILAACQGGSIGQSKIQESTVQDAQRATEIKDVQFIDVRTESEYSGGHAAKAVNFPLDDLEKNLTKLDKDKPVYVICQTGRRSQKGAEILEKANFKEIHNVSGGTDAWIDAGLPVEK